MAASVVSSAKNGGFVAGNTGVSVTHGFSLQNGDYVVAFISKGDDTGSAYASTSGGTWTSGAGPLSTTTGNDMMTEVLYRKVTNAAGEPSSYTFTVTGTTESRAMNVIVVQVRGADGTNFLDVTSTTNTGTNDFTPTHVNITTVTDGCLVLMCHAGSLTDGTATGKTGGKPAYADALIDYRGAADSATLGFDSFIEVAYKANAPVGTQTIAAWTGTADDSSSEWHVITLAVRPQGVTTYSSSFTANAALKKTQSGSFSANAVIFANSGTKTFTAAAWKVLVFLGSFTASAIVAKTTATSFAANAIAWKTQSGSFTSAAIRHQLQAGSFSVSAIILRVQAGSPKADAILKATMTSSAKADAVLARAQAGAFTLDATIGWVAMGAFTANAGIWKSVSGSFLTDAVMWAQQAGAFTLDAAALESLDRSFKADARITTGNEMWTTPASGAEVTPVDVYAFLIPALPYGRPIHFEMHFDKVETFDGPDLRIYKSHLSQAGWEYWDGGAWQTVPQGGVDPSYVGNEARFTVSDFMTEGVWYRRVRGGEI